ASFINDFAKLGLSEASIDAAESSVHPTAKRVLGKKCNGPSNDRPVNQHHPVVFAQCAKSTINVNPDPKAGKFIPFPYFT
ncbi:hypothetical protein, partial [Vibrio cholerae]|uniref:hypothetical protein n=1 Tax=Vibrio cholerae TaxID=666 RepID=UPI001F2EE000